MWKTLNLELFTPWFIFSFKWNKHLVVKDYQTEVLVINLDWDDCEILNNACDYCIDEDFYNSFDDVFYKLSYLDILEDILHGDTLRWEDINYNLLIEEEYDNTDTSYN